MATYIRYQVPSTGNLQLDIAQLMTDLNEMGTEKRNEAVAAGPDTMTGRDHKSQSHAYMNAAMWLQKVLDQHTA